MDSRGNQRTLTDLTPYVFLDTNILVYAHGVDDHDSRSKLAGRLMDDLWESRMGMLCTQVLQEFYRVATRKLLMPRAEARGIVASYMDWCAVSTDLALIVSASKLEEDHTLGFWDALVISSALRGGATRLLSEDLQHGRKFGFLTIENPFLGRCTSI